jgi:hypothetical protein
MHEGKIYASRGRVSLHDMMDSDEGSAKAVLYFIRVVSILLGAASLYSFLTK